MDNKNIFILRRKEFNQKLKELFKKKLKDRNKSKGYSFSSNRSISPFKQKKTISQKKKDFKKIIKEKELKSAMGDYLELKHTIYSLEKENKIKKKINENKNFSKDKINYSNLKELLNEFLRDKNKHTNNMNTITKSKIKLDNVNRNIRVNRINSILSKVSLHFNKVKTKVDVGQNEKEYNENSFNYLIVKLNESRKKLEHKINNSRKKSKSFDIKKFDNIEKLVEKQYTIKTNNNIEIKNEYNNLNTIDENKKTISNNITNLKYFNLYNSIYNEENKNYRKKKIKLQKHNFNNIRDSIDNKIKKKLKERPLTFSRNRNIINENFNKNSFNIKNKTKNEKRLLKTENNKRKFKVKNLPLYTTKIEDIMNEYYKIKKKIKSTKIRYKENHIITYSQIDNIVKVKEDLLIFLLKQKYLNSHFPPKLIKKPNKREIFIQKFKDNFDLIYRRYLDNFISI